MNEAVKFGELKPGAGELGIMYLGQAGFMFTTGNGVLMVDPYLSNSVEKLVGPEARRMWWNSFMISDLRPDAIAITHGHLDHLDPETLPILEQVALPVMYLGPGSVIEHLRQLNFRRAALTCMERGDAAQFGGMALRAVYAEHTPDSIGIVLRTSGLSVYITGDTCLRPELINEETRDCDVVIACINGIDDNLSPLEAAQLAAKLNAKILIPMHYGLIPCSTVSINAFHAATDSVGVEGFVMPVEQAFVLKPTRDGVEALRAELEG